MDKELEAIICDRLEAWELCEFLQITTEDFIVAFRDTVEDNIEDVRELCGIVEDSEDD